VLLPLILLFIVVPIVEIYVIIQVGRGDRRAVDDRAARGRLDPRLGADALAGARRVAALQRRRSGQSRAAREVLDGVLVIFGGALLLTPGFVTDIFGLLFLLPPTRARHPRAARAARRRADRLRGDGQRPPAPVAAVGRRRRRHGDRGRSRSLP
jgi:UPF0716 protein FxsA